MQRKRLEFLTFFGDYILAFVSLAIVIVIRYDFSDFFPVFWKHFPSFSLLFLLWALVFAVLDLHRIDPPPPRFGVAVSIILALSMAFFYLLPFFQLSPKTNLLLLVLIFAFWISLWRLGLRRTLIIMGIMRPVMIAGTEKESCDLALTLYQNKIQGYDLLYFFSPHSPPPLVPLPLEKAKEKLHEFVAQRRLFAFVFDNSWLETHSLDLVYYCISRGVRVYHVADFVELLEEKLPIRSISNTWMINNFHGRNQKSIYLLFKRIFDVTVAILGFPFLFLAYLIMAPLIKLESRGPILYSQKRVGRNSAPFVIYKFRTMYKESEKNGAQWAKHNDPRITRFGRFMRKMRIDELPQFFNVIKGDMSIIGPRPERPEFTSLLGENIPHYGMRHLIRPGITGWAQTRYRYGSSKEDAIEKLSYDLYYIKNISAILDIRILLRTLFIIFAQRGR